MIVDEIGRPIEPLKSSPGRLMHAAGEVSVRPQACVSTLPVTSFQRSATACCTAMPPPRLTRSPLKSRLSKPLRVQQRIEERVDAREEREAVPRQLLARSAAKSRGFGIRMLCAPSLIIVRLFAVSAKM